jgi:hypothetical protein
LVDGISLIGLQQLYEKKHSRARLHRKRSAQWP